MAKGIRERLLKEAIKFHQWQEATYPGKTSEELGGEWEVDYQYWNLIACFSRRSRMPFAMCSPHDSPHSFPISNACSTRLRSRLEKLFAISSKLE